MRFLPRFSRALAVLAIPTLMSAAATDARAATHVVISEFATRGSSSATDEFVELYNPTDNAIDISGWKQQYKSASGTTWSDRAILPANSSIPARGFFLIANTSYVGSVTPDYTSSLWTSGTGMADNGHVRIIDASAVEVDKVGWGSAIDPEGGSTAPNHGTSANGNSVERKAQASSTADSLAAGGAHALLGNGQDTNVNGADFVTQTHGRNPQNSSNAPEPAFSGGGNGTGRASVQPAVVFTDRSVDALTLSFRQDSSYTVTNLSIFVPPDWTWSHQLASVALAGTAFQSATPTISGDTLFIAQAALSPTDSGSVTIANLTSPSTKGNSTFTVRTAVAAGTLAPILQHPRVRVLELVPIVVVHVNDASGVPTSPYGIGAEATVTGVVTVNFSSSRTDVYLQDGTAGINLFSFDLPPFTLQPGDSLTVTGSILQFRGLTELQPEFALLVLHATGRPVPEPMVATCADVNATFHPDGTEPNEGRLVRVNGVTYNQTSSTITDASGTTNIFIPNTFPPVPSVFDVIGILKQFKPGTPAPGPPYTADYEISPRAPDDIIAHPGPIILSTPYEDHIQPTSVQLHWTTDVASSSIVYYGLTPALGDSVVDATPVSNHAPTVSGLTPATVYYYSVGSSDVNGTNYAPSRLFSTASPPQSTGVMNVYFNKSVNTTLAWLHQANGNQDLPARIVPHIDQARRSLDAAFYNLSGAPGSALATALINAKNRGVKVRVICEEDNKTNAPFASINSNGIPLITDRFDPVNNGLGLMHNKFLVIDGRGGAAESAWVWTGSWNPTNEGTNDDFQNSIEIQDQALANAYTLEFNEMWGSSTDAPNASSSRFGARKLDDTPHKFVVGGHSVECYFSPSDGVTSHIISTINGAQQSIGFELLTLTRSDVASALVARHQSGIGVRGDLDSNSDTGSQYSYLTGNGVDVRLKTGVSGLLHHKYCIVDAESPGWDATTLTGSHNWSSAAENSNNENTLIVHDPDVTNQYLQEFAARYYQFGGSDSLRVSVELIDGHAPRVAFLGQNYPNPFRSATRIVYAIPIAEQVVLKVYDLQGRELRTLVNQRQTPGRYRVDLGVKGIASGVYFYRLEVGGAVQQRKMLILK
ncbi:MAG: T9SS type A sorting domain-containing protein [Candidatus Eisenbacteria bacterium]|uniref:phospholipase D n=1 Tax=Eiseniibacteriota bacterium TaxID=2212470 RepID=A0A538SIN8_UNCEI|nr:MAG: T9SS type A sorting domain-containing protein [Candidatus Eisenbacteria bacterium]